MAIKKTDSGGQAVRPALRAFIDGLKDTDQAVRLTMIRDLGEIGSRLSRAGADPETVKEMATTLVALLKDAGSGHPVGVGVRPGEDSIVVAVAWDIPRSTQRPWTTRWPRCSTIPMKAFASRRSMP